MQRFYEYQTGSVERSALPGQHELKGAGEMFRVSTLDQTNLPLTDKGAVDYSQDFANTKLISGSYNLSRTAEHNQFDNMVIYSGLENKQIYSEFKEEFDNQWSMNRDPQDRPDQTVLDGFTKLKGDSSIPIHSKVAISLNWKEIKSLRSKVNKTAKGIFKNLYKNRDCLYFDFVKNSFWGCPR